MKAIILFLCFVFNGPWCTLQFATPTHVAFAFPIFKFSNIKNWTSTTNLQCMTRIYLVEENFDSVMPNRMLQGATFALLESLELL